MGAGFSYQTYDMRNTEKQMPGRGDCVSWSVIGEHHNIYFIVIG